MDLCPCRHPPWQSLSSQCTLSFLHPLTSDGRDMSLFTSSLWRHLVQCYLILCGAASEVVSSCWQLAVDIHLSNDHVLWRWRRRLHTRHIHQTTRSVSLSTATMMIMFSHDDDACSQTHTSATSDYSQCVSAAVVSVWCHLTLLSTVLTARSVMCVCPFICFHYSFWTDLWLFYGMCVDHDHSLLGLKVKVTGQGRGLRSGLAWHRSRTVCFEVSC